MTTYGLTDTGFTAKTAAVIEDELIESITSIPGFEDIPTDGSSAWGNLISIISEREALLWGLLLAIWQSLSRATATGQSLDNAFANIGKSRNLEEHSTVTLTLYNTTNTNPVTVEEGTQLRQSATGVVWETLGEVEIPAITTEGDTESITVDAQSLTAGAFEATIGTINEVVTGISGLDLVSNLEAAIVGRSQENDAEAKVRVANELTIAQGSTIAAIKAQLLQVDGVTYVTAQQNRTASIVDSNAPHSYRFTVVGGTDQNVIDTIGFYGAGAIETNGTESGTYTDSEGVPVAIFFDRATEINPYIIVNLTVGADYPASGDDTIAAAVEAKEFESGQDLYNYLLIQATANAEVPGIESMVIYQGESPSPTDSDTITVDADEIINITLDRITVNS